MYRLVELIFHGQFSTSGVSSEPRDEHSESVHIKDIADDTYVMVPDACGLSHATRALFRSQRKTLHEYPGQALSYQVLEDWATLNVGAAIMPKSKVSRNMKAARVIRGKGDEIARIGFEAVSPQERQRAAHLLAFEKHLRRVVPRLLQGLVQDSLFPEPVSKAPSTKRRAR